MEHQASLLDGVSSGSFVLYTEDKIQHSDDEHGAFSSSALSRHSKTPNALWQVFPMLVFGNSSALCRWCELLHCSSYKSNNHLYRYWDHNTTDEQRTKEPFHPRLSRWKAEVCQLRHQCAVHNCHHQRVYLNAALAIFLQKVVAYSTAHKEVAALQAILQRMSAEVPMMLQLEAKIHWVTQQLESIFRRYFFHLLLLICCGRCVTVRLLIAAMMVANFTIWWS